MHGRNSMMICQIVVKLHNYFLRRIACLTKSSSLYRYMLRAELGRHPIQISIMSCNDTLAFLFAAKAT